MMIVDEFESRFDADYIFQGSKDDVVALWLNNKSRWYPDVLVTKNNLGDMWCSVTGVICEDLHTMPLFCLGGMKHVSCTSGETLHVCEAVKREDILPLKHHTQTGREDSRKMDYCI
jgi:hypothetical protein